MKRRFLMVMMILLMSFGLYGSISTSISPDDVAVTSRVTYSYQATLPDKTIRHVESPVVLTTRQVQTQAVAIYDAEQTKLKDIDRKVSALTYANTFIDYREWVLYRKIIAYRYRYRLPDGSSNWIDSKTPKSEAECLTIVKAAYRQRLMEAEGLQ